MLNGKKVLVMEVEVTVIQSSFLGLVPPGPARPVESIPMEAKLNPCCPWSS